MSRPPINPDKTLAGIAVDPQTLERVIPESKRPDGTVRKQIKIRPGFTPQEDVRRFRGTRQAQMDAIALPKGHIVGWAPPSNASSSKAGTKSGNAFPALSKSANSSSGGGEKPLSKSAKKNAKRKEKREEKKVTDESIFVKDNWEDDDDDGGDVKEGTPINQDGSGLSTTEASTSTQANPDSTGLEEKLSDLQVS